MPHMTRLPLEDYEGLAHTELWEQSELEVRKRRLQTLAEYSEDESSPPHRIYRREGAGTKRTKISNLFSRFMYYLFLPLCSTYSATRYLLRKIVYDIPAQIHNIEKNLLMKSEQAKESKTRRILSKGWKLSKSVFYSFFSALLLILSLPITAGNATSQYLFATKPASTKESEVTASTPEQSDLISEDEDESGLTEFVSAQKHIYSFREHLEDQEKNTDVEKYGSVLMKSSYILQYFTSLLLFPVHLLSGFWDDFLNNMNETASERSDVDYQELIDEDSQPS